MTDTNPIAITLCDLIGLNAPIKRQRLLVQIKKQVTQTSMYEKAISNIIKQIKRKEMAEDTPC